MSTYKFISRYIREPQSIGALFPSTNALGMTIGHLVKSLDESIALVELGPGTGSITKHLPDVTVSVEREVLFSDILKEKFKLRKIITADAITYLSSIIEPVNIVSSIPLINNPDSEKLKGIIKKLHQESLLKNIITYSYGSQSPLADCKFCNGIKRAKV